MNYRDDGERMTTLREKASELPLHPGIYIMKDKSGKVIYVGKSKVLKQRVSQYFAAEPTTILKRSNGLAGARFRDDPLRQQHGRRSRSKTAIKLYLRSSTSSSRTTRAICMSG